MIELACAFYGHGKRADICQKEATSFFRTAKGTMWPMCPACSDRHKMVGTKIIGRGLISTDMMTEATFDIPINDESIAAFRAQDPERIRATFAQAAELLLGVPKSEY